MLHTRERLDPYTLVLTPPLPAAPHAPTVFAGLSHARFNKVLLSKLATERERDRLREENEQMQSILKQFLEGISITEDTVRGANPLLVVNGASNTLPMPVREAGHVAVVESNHMVETGRVYGRHF